MSLPADIQQYRDTGLLPFQAELVNSLLTSPIPARRVLVAPVGTGKTRTAIFLASKIAEADPNHRILIIGPRPMVSMYQHHLKQTNPNLQATVVTRRILRELEGASKIDSPIWPAPFAAVMGMDTARQDDVRNNLSTVNWDLVVLEEVHLFARSRWTLLKTILSNNVFQRVLMMTATPDLKAIASLLKGVEKTEWNALHLTDWDGRSLYSTPNFVTVEYRRGEDEVALLSNVAQLTQQLKPNTNGRFVKAMMLAQAASSPLALERTIRQLRNNLAHSRSELFMASEMRRITEDSAEDPSADTFASTASGTALLLNKPEALRVLYNLIDQIDTLSSDKKREALENLIEHFEKSDTQKPLRISVFCSFRATAHYLQTVLSERGNKVWLLMGGQTSEQLHMALNGFKRDGGILVATAVALTGVDLRDVPIFIHYDPANESQMYARVSRNSRATHYFLKDTSNVLPDEWTGIEKGNILKIAAPKL